MPLEPNKSFFSGVSNARATLDANYIRSGHYWMMVRKCKLDETRKHEPFAANEFVVIRVFSDDQGLGHRLGEECTHFIANYGAQKDYFLGTVNGFIACAIGCLPTEVTEDVCVGVYNLAQQPLAGTVIEVASRTILKKNGKPENPKDMFTRVTYKRAVPFSEVAATLSDQDRARFFPAGVLEKCIEEENAGRQPQAA